MKKLKYPKLGSKIYVLEYSAEKYTTFMIKERVITGVWTHADKDLIMVNLDNQKNYNASPYFQPYDRTMMWFSFKKASSVCDSKNKAEENKRIRLKQYGERFNELEANLEDVENKYIGKEVLVKTCTRTNGKHSVVWRVEKIKKGDFHPHVKTNSYYFLKDSICLLSKEGKTWKFYTDRLKLEMQKEELEKRLKEVEEKLQKEK